VPPPLQLVIGTLSVEHESVTVDSIPLRLDMLIRMRALGVEPAKALKCAGLSETLLVEGPVHISTREFFDLWSALPAAGADAQFGLRLGTEVPVHKYHLAFVVALHAASVQEALAALGRYKRLVGPEEVIVERGSAEMGIQFRWTFASSPIPDLLGDASFASLLLLLSRGLGKRVIPHRLELTRHAVNEEMLKRHFGCPVHFNKGRDMIVFAASLFDEPFITHNSELVEVLIPGLETQLQGREMATLVEQAKAAVARHMRGRRPTVSSVARELRLSARTLQRRLQESQTSFQEVLDAARRDAACRLLKTTELSMTEIAFLLGFDELNSFVRAFQRWEGMLPARWREKAARPHSRSGDKNV
jgi:AraC-like DNA-binding protein